MPQNIVCANHHVSAPIINFLDKKKFLTFVTFMTLNMIWKPKIDYDILRYHFVIGTCTLFCAHF